MLNQEKKVRKLYRKLLNDSDFEILELELKNPNIFQILDISKAEIRHSNFLGWLLDSNENHGLNELFLLKFIRGIAMEDTLNSLDEFEIFKINFDTVEIRREWKNIDLLINFENLVICIENKIDTKDHSKQLEKYHKTINEFFPKKKKIFVYLTPFGEKPISKFGQENYSLYSYEKIIEQLNKILKIHGKSLNKKIFQYIDDYKAILKRDLMKNDKLNDIAGKIYSNHKELIDFIIENKPDLASNLYPIFQEFFEKKGLIIHSKNKGYLKFLTPKLSEIIPNEGQGWPQKENFLFEIDFFWNKNKIVFKTIISPSNKEEISKILNKSISKVEKSKKPEGKKWLTHFIHSWKFNKDIYLDSINKDEIFENLEQEWNKIEEIIYKVEKQILLENSKLREYKK